MPVVNPIGGLPTLRGPGRPDSPGTAALTSGPIADLVSLLVDAFDVGGWRSQAACQDGAAVAGIDFFPGRGVDPGPAKAVCARCPVRPECLDFALDNRVRFGVFGGTTEYERRKLRPRLPVGRPRGSGRDRMAAGQLRAELGSVDGTDVPGGDLACREVDAGADGVPPLVLPSRPKVGAVRRPLPPICRRAARPRRTGGHPGRLEPDLCT